MLSIRHIRRNQNKADPSYTVELSDGRTVAGLKRSDLVSYGRFELALAFLGLRVNDLQPDQYRWFSSVPRCDLRRLWLDTVASAIKAGVDAGTKRPRGRARVAKRGAAEVSR